jgi:hypothetical protein
MPAEAMSSGDTSLAQTAQALNRLQHAAPKKPAQAAVDVEDDRTRHRLLRVWDEKMARLMGWRESFDGGRKRYVAPFESEVVELYSKKFESRENAALALLKTLSFSLEDMEKGDREWISQLPQKYNDLIAAYFNSKKEKRGRGRPRKKSTPRTRAVTERIEKGRQNGALDLTKRKTPAAGANDDVDDDGGAHGAEDTDATKKRALDAPAPAPKRPKSSDESPSCGASSSSDDRTEDEEQTGNSQPNEPEARVARPASPEKTLLRGPRPEGGAPPRAEAPATDNGLVHAFPLHQTVFAPPPRLNDMHTLAALKSDGDSRLRTHVALLKRVVSTRQHTADYYEALECVVKNVQDPETLVNLLSETLERIGWKSVPGGGIATPRGAMLGSTATDMVDFFSCKEALCHYIWSGGLREHRFSSYCILRSFLPDSPAGIRALVDKMGDGNSDDDARVSRAGRVLYMRLHIESCLWSGNGDGFMKHIWPLLERIGFSSQTPTPADGYSPAGVIVPPPGFDFVSLPCYRTVAEYFRTRVTLWDEPAMSDETRRSVAEFLASDSDRWPGHDCMVAEAEEAERADARFPPARVYNDCGLPPFAQPAPAVNAFRYPDVLDPSWRLVELVKRARAVPFPTEKFVMQSLWPMLEKMGWRVENIKGGFENVFLTPRGRVRPATAKDGQDSFTGYRALFNEVYNGLTSFSAEVESTLNCLFPPDLSVRATNQN